MTVIIDPHTDPGLWFRADGADEPRPVPLTRVDVQARVVGPTQRVRLVQSFRNDQGVPVEATYTFPVPEGAAVSHFLARLDGHELRGEVMDADEAFDAYDDAVEEGRGAWLLDANRPDLFTVSVGNLLPGATLDVELSYVAELPREGAGYRLVIPQNFTPKYFPAHARQGDDVDDATAMDVPRTTGPLPYRWDIRIDVELPGHLARLNSPSHRIETSFEGTAARVTLAADEGRPDRDFVLAIASDAASPDVAGIFENEHGRFFAASIRPVVAPGHEAAVDAVFLVDCSGSMHGASISDARRALLLALRSLREGDRFRIIRFGSDFESFTDDLVVYDEKSMTQATRAIEKMDADLGGTELGRPLQAIADRATELTNVVLVTDGATGDDARLIQFASAHRERIRLFTIGVGRGASTQLVDGLASASGGAAEYVVPGEQIAGKVARHFARLRVPAIEKLRFEFEGIEVGEIAPALPERLFPSDAVNLYGRVRNGDSGRFRIVGEWDGAPWSTELPVSAMPGSAVPVLWARERCRQLEAEWQENSGSRRGNPRHRRRVEQNARQTLVDLACEFSLVTEVTSFVIVDSREDAPRAKVPAQFSRVPLALMGFGDAQHSITHYFCGSPSAPKDLMMRARSLISFDQMIDRKMPPDPSPLDALLYQRADGSWPASRELFALIGLDEDRIAALLALDEEEATRETTELVIEWVGTHERSIQRTMAEPLRKATEWLRAHAH